MRLLRTLFNFAIDEYEENDMPIFKVNPARRINWNRERPRTRLVPLIRMREWFDGVLLLDTPVIRDYLITCLLTGMRSTEVASMQWDFIDWDTGYVTLPDTKNGDPHTLPMSTFLRALFQERYSGRSSNVYVFPGGRRNNKPSGYLKSPYKAIDKVIERTGIQFSPHDLRRTFLAVAEEVGVDEFTRKRLVNHSFQDVTGRHYSVKNPEKLREPMERISNHVLKLAELI